MIVTTGATGKTTSASPTSTPASTAQSLAAVERNRIGIRQEMKFVFVVGRYFDSEVVVRAAAHAPIVTGEPPVLSAIIRTPKFAAISFLSLVGDAVSRFDQRIDAI